MDPWTGSTRGCRACFQSGGRQPSSSLFSLVSLHHHAGLSSAMQSGKKAGGRQKLVAVVRKRDADKEKKQNSKQNLLTQIDTDNVIPEGSSRSRHVPERLGTAGAPSAQSVKAHKVSVLAKACSTEKSQPNSKYHFFGHPNKGMQQACRHFICTFIHKNNFITGIQAHSIVKQ